MVIMIIFMIIIRNYKMILLWYVSVVCINVVAGFFVYLWLFMAIIMIIDDYFILTR